MKVSAIIVAGCLRLSTAALAQGVDDAQIASIVVTANQVDVDAGKLAVSVSTSPDVKAFAQRMITDHLGVNKSATELVTKLNVTPQDNPTSQSLKAGGERNVATLKGLDGAKFDRAYIDHEVAYHEQVLDAVDKTLIPGAKNEELKALLVKYARRLLPTSSTPGTFSRHSRRASSHVPLDIVRGPRGLAIVAVALGLCWCSGGPGAGAHAAAAATHTVTIEGTRFEPSALTVNAGDTVVWINKDPFPHTATSETGAFDSKEIGPETTWRHVPTKKGTFAYVCRLHPTMKATLQVR